MPNVVAPVAAVGLTICAMRGALGQERPLLEPPEFVLSQWTTAAGLPQNSVTAIAQTPDGYLWVGTFGGLARFDGSTFRFAQRVDSAGQHTDRILSLAAGRDSALWIGTEAGLLRYRDGRFEVFTVANGLPDDEVSALHVDSGGTLWIGTARGGLARFDGRRFQAVPAPDGSRLSYVFSIAETNDRTIWINLANSFVIIAAGGDTARMPRDRRSESFVLEEPSGARWFQRAGGLIRVHGDVVRRFGPGDGLPVRATMTGNTETGYWLATANDGLFFFLPGRPRAQVTQYPLPDGRRRYRVRSSFVDRDGNVWFGTDASGLLLAQRNLFTTYTSAHGLSHEVMTAVFGDAAGTMWVGTNCGGLNAVQRARGVVRTFKPRRPNDPAGDPCVFSITESPAGTLWIGTWGGGLTRLRNGTEERIRNTGLRDSVLLALFTDRSGTVWVGMNSGGLAALRDGRVVASYDTADGLPHNSVRAIYQSRDGSLWLGTLGGLSRLSDGRFTNYGAAKGLSSQHVRAIHEDADGNLWIGTYGGGMNLLRGDSITAIRREDGLAEDVVSSILEDDFGRLWTSGNLGVARVARSELLNFANRTTRRVRSVLYGTDDGLILAETNGGFQPAAWKDREGRLWYPTVRGVAVVDPARARVEDPPPDVSVEQVIVNGEPRAAIDAIVVGPGRTNLEFRYAGLSLSAPRHLTFRYRLISFDDEWVDAGSRRAAYYPRLPPGQYRFLVTAANRDGVWNTRGAEVPVRVSGPFWTSLRFRAAAILTVLLVAVLVMRRRAMAARRWRDAHEEFARRLIESQEHERKRVAGELHDGLGQELLVIKNRALLALRGQGEGSGSVRDQLEQINAVATQSLDGVRGLAHNLTPYQLDHLGLSAALRTMIDTASHASDVRFEQQVDDVDGVLSKEGEINLYRIVQEAITNVVRHSRATTAAVQVRRAANTISVIVRDDGRGFHVRRDGAGRLGGGFGLTGIAERTRIIDGRLNVVSAPGQGTRLELDVPLRSTNSTSGDTR
jgi:signal transduction histidine kinase/ligand-binding sensor domain-containing protein